MAWFDRSPGGKKGPSETPARPDVISVGSEVGSKQEEAASSLGDELVAYLYKGSRVTGQVTFHGAAKIDGSVEGEILCHGLLTIGEEAEVRANVSGDVVVIRGRVHGDVAAKQKVELEAPARLFGNIGTPRLTIAEGVVFEGHCSMVETMKKDEFVNPVISRSEKALEGEVPKLVTESEK